MEITLRKVLNYKKAFFQTPPVKMNSLRRGGLHWSQNLTTNFRDSIDMYFLCINLSYFQRKNKLLD